jgi:hypothetical protein
MIIAINVVLAIVHALALVALLTMFMVSDYEGDETTFRVSTIGLFAHALLPYVMVLVSRILRYWGIIQ